MLQTKHTSIGGIWFIDTQIIKLYCVSNPISIFIESKESSFIHIGLDKPALKRATQFRDKMMIDINYFGTKITFIILWVIRALYKMIILLLCYSSII
jgi:hypothetical protein